MVRDSLGARGTLAAVLTAGLFLTYLIGLAPHLVHHLFDEAQGRPACPHLAQSQQTPEWGTEPPALAPPAEAELLPVHRPEPHRLALDLTHPHPRAPPRTGPST